MKLSPDIKIPDLFSIPAVRYADLKDRVAVGKLHVIGDVVGAVADGCPVTKLALREHNCVRSVAQQEFFLSAAGGPGYDFFCPQLGKGEGGLKGAEEIVSDRDQAYIIAVDAYGFHKGFISAVPDPCLGSMGEDAVDAAFILVDDQSLVTQVMQLHGGKAPESACSNNQYVFHNSFSLFSSFFCL